MPVGEDRGEKHFMDSPAEETLGENQNPKGEIKAARNEGLEIKSK